MPMLGIGFILIMTLLNFISANTEDTEAEWNSQCPKTCSCHIGHFSQLHFSSMMHHDKQFEEEVVKTKTKPSYQERNEVLYEEDETMNHLKNNDPVMKMAVCIINGESTLKQALDDLKDTEVLTLLQSSSDENLTLQRDNFKELRSLKALLIHGIDQHIYNQHIKNLGQLYLKDNALQGLQYLEYINLQNVQLLGSPQQGNKVPPVSAYDYINQKFESNQILPLIHPNYEQKIQRKSYNMIKPIVKSLIFLTPNDVQAEIVPYEVFKEELQKTGLYSFAGLKNLKFLRIYQCNLSEINWEMFDGLCKLETLSLEGNDLLFIPEFAFYGTPGLKSLSLAKNKLLSVQSMSLAGLLQLQHFDLSYNNISHLSELSFPPFPRLISADFMDNPLEIIFPNTFEVMNATQQLHLGSLDTLLDIQPNSFNGLHSLLKLTIKNIDLDILEREVLRGMPQLKQLKITGKIKSIAFDVFLDMPKLEKLVLKNCSIEKLSMDSFYGLYDLKTLDISHNLLDSLPPGLFDQQFSLKELYLQYNNLTILPTGFFSNIPAKLIRLDGNPWHCSCAMKGWKPSIINQVKQKAKGLCQFRFDKGSMCSLAGEEEYIYDKKVEPRCSTPKKYKGWSVFHLMRKELRCDKKQNVMKINRKAYLAQKMLDYEKMKENEKLQLHTLKKNYKIIHEAKKINQFNNDKVVTTDSKQTPKEELLEQVTIKSTEDHDKEINNNLKLNFTKELMSNKNESNQFKVVNNSSILLENDTTLFMNMNNLLIKKKTIQQTDVKELMFSKKEKEKLELLKEKEERLKMKEKIKNSGDIDANKLKTVWKIELEKKRKEKYKLLNMNALV